MEKSHSRKNSKQNLYINLNSDKEFKTVISRKPAKLGTTYIFTIPKEMIDFNIIDPDKFYELWIKEFDDSK